MTTTQKKKQMYREDDEHKKMNCMLGKAISMSVMMKTSIAYLDNCLITCFYSIATKSISHFLVYIYIYIYVYMIDEFKGLSRLDRPPGLSYLTSNI